MVSVACFILVCSCIAISRCDEVTEGANVASGHSSKVIADTEANNSTVPKDISKSTVARLLAGETSSDSNSTDDGLIVRSMRKKPLSRRNGAFQRRERARNKGSRPNSSNALIMSGLTDNDPSQKEQRTIDETNDSPTEEQVMEGTDRKNQYQSKFNPKIERSYHSATEDDSSETSDEEDIKNYETQSSTPSSEYQPQEESIVEPSQQEKVSTEKPTETSSDTPAPTEETMPTEPSQQEMLPVEDSSEKSSYVGNPPEVVPIHPLRLFRRQLDPTGIYVRSPYSVDVPFNYYYGRNQAYSLSPVRGGHPIQYYPAPGGWGDLAGSWG